MMPFRHIRLRWSAILGLWMVLLLCPLALQAREARSLAEDEGVEKRMLAISEELRCLVCQNETLAASHADLANDLRREIRSLIQQGKSDQEIIDLMVERYGNFVRYRPPLERETLLLWFGPFLLLAGAGWGLVRYLRRRNQALAKPASAAGDAP